METLVAIISAAKLLGLDATKIMEAVVIFFMVFFMVSFIFGFILWKLSKPILKVVIELKAEIINMTASITGLGNSLHEHVKLTNTSFEDGKEQFAEIRDDMKFLSQKIEVIEAHVGLHK